MIRVATGILLIVLAPVAAAFVAANVLLGLAMTSGHATLSFTSAGLALVSVAAVVAHRGVRRVSQAGALRFGVPAVAAAVTILVPGTIAWELLLAPAPASDPSPNGVAHWELPTGSRIAYRHTPAVGSPVRAAPVLMVHGGPGSPDADPAALAAHLAGAGFHVYAYHQLGAGLSSRLADVTGYTVERHVADVEAIRQELGAGRLVLVGASWGGQLIASYLATHPKRVERAVVASPATLWAPAWTDATRLSPGGRTDQGAVIGRHPRFLLAHVLLGIAGPRGATAVLPDERIDGAFEAMVTELDMWAGCPGRTAPADDGADEGGRGFGFWVNAMTTQDSRNVPDPRPALGAAATPVLVLRAECDYVAWEVTREYRDVLPTATLVAVDDAGHVLAKDRPDLYRELVAAFLLGDPLALPAYAGTGEPWGRAPGDS